MNILKDLSEHFLHEVNIHFIHDNISTIEKFTSKEKWKKFITEKYNKEIWLYLKNFLNVNEEHRFWEWSDSKEVITTELKEGDSEIPVMTNLIDFLSEHYPGLSKEDISTITNSCQCIKTIRPDYREYHNFYCKYEIELTLDELSEKLTDIFSEQNIQLEFVDINKVIEKLSLIVPTMTLDEYAAFSRYEHLDKILRSSSEKGHKIKI